MPRSVNHVASRARRKKILKLTRGYFGCRRNVWTVAKNTWEKGLTYAYRDRKDKKRNFRALWIQRINAAARMEDLSYSKLMGTGVTNRNDEQITLEDLMKINLHNRKMTLLLIGGLISVMVSVLNFAYVIALQSTTLSTQYMLYRYIATGQYANAPVNYMRLMIPSMITGAIGLVLFICYVIETRRKGD